MEMVHRKDDTEMTKYKLLDSRQVPSHLLGAIIQATTFGGGY